MTIVDDYVAIAVELRRLRAEKLPDQGTPDVSAEPMRAPSSWRLAVAGEVA